MGSAERQIQKAFQRVTFQHKIFNDDKENCFPASCSICLDDFECGQDIVCAPCSSWKHVFHEPCLTRWLRTTQTCPLCRHPFAAAQEERSQGGFLDVESASAPS